MKKNNSKKYLEYRDIHGNVYHVGLPYSMVYGEDDKVGSFGKTKYTAINEAMVGLKNSFEVFDKEHLPPGYSVGDIEGHVCGEGMCPMESCGKNFRSGEVCFILDKLTHRCELKYVKPSFPKLDYFSAQPIDSYLGAPIYIDGIPVRLPKDACVYVNAVPTIENGEITGINSYQCVAFDFFHNFITTAKSCGLAGVKDGSIERILYDIGEKTDHNNTDNHVFAIDKGRIIHSYLARDRNKLCVEFYELKNGGNNKFSVELKSSTEIPWVTSSEVECCRYQTAIIGNKLYIYDDGSKHYTNGQERKRYMLVYEIMSNNQLQPTYKDDITDCHSMQDFLNRTALKTNCRRLPYSDYAKMEKAYIEKELHKKLKDNCLTAPIDINGIPVRLPKGAKIHVNTVPTIENGEIIGINSYPSIELSDAFIEQLEFAKSIGAIGLEDGSIERILYDIGKKTANNSTSRHLFSIDKGRIVHGYHTKDHNYIEIYELKTEENNKFSVELKASTEVPRKVFYHDIVVIGDKIYLGSKTQAPGNNEARMAVYKITSDNQLKLDALFADKTCYGIQDFLNRYNLISLQPLLPNNDYAKMEKAYIERKEKENAPAQPMMNNQDTNTGLNKKRGDGKCSIQ